MGFSSKQKMLIFERDDWECVPHAGGCGGDLVAHHRANRGMGGCGSADRVSNGLTVCSGWNFLVEADARVAEVARSRGWKISKALPPDKIPVFYPESDELFLLDDEGGREVFTDDVPF